MSRPIAAQSPVADAQVIVDGIAASAKLRALGDALRAAFVERDAEVRALLVALVARQHVLLLGDPGTGKSALVNALTRALTDGDPRALFVLLFTRYSVPEEVFGPFSLKGLEADEYRRVTTGYLPTCKLAFLDEVFKANSAILNALLTALNERVFDNGGKRDAMPLELCVGASNELPAEGEGLDALYDRFTLRRWVEPVKNRDALRALLATRGEPTVAARVSPADLAAVRGLADRVDVPNDVLDALLDIRDGLAQEHGITASDRRWRKCVGLVRASAALAGRDVATKADLVILSDALWREPAERAKVSGTLSKVAAPDLAAALRVLDAANEAVGRAKLTDPKTEVTVIAQANAELKAMLVELRKLDQGAGVADITRQVEALHKRVAATVMEKLGMGGGK